MPRWLDHFEGHPKVIYIIVQYPLFTLDLTVQRVRITGLIELTGKLFAWKSFLLFKFSRLESSCKILNRTKISRYTVPILSKCCASYNSYHGVR